MTSTVDTAATRQVEELRSEVKRLQAQVCKMEAKLRSQEHEDFSESVRYERNRSQRYNHYFAVISLECDPSRDATDILETVRKCVRNVDTVDLLSDESSALQPSAGSQSGEVGDGKRRSGAVSWPELSGKAGQDRISRIGIVLPHANKKGAKIVSTRLAACLSHSLRKSAVAVYPSDSTNCAELLSRVGG